MAIGYARAEFVKRSSGKNACAKAAYNARSRVEFNGNCSLDPEVYDWSSKEPPAFHEVLLPKGAHEKFKDLQVLWNAAEAREKRYNSQVAIEVLLALPDDKVISLEDRIHLTKTFIQTHFIDKGLAAQIDVHAPERKIQITRGNKEIGLSEGMAGNVEAKDNLFAVQLDNGKAVSFDPQEFTGFVEKERNWHAHVLITTRRFLNDGSGLGEKSRDLMPRIANGKVISGPDWGKLWTDHQNAFFKEKGLDLRVDIPGIEAQEHLGPFRMRGRAFALLQEHGRILEENAIKAKDASCVLNKITERQSVFTKEDVDRFLQKHVPFEHHADFSTSFWNHQELVHLVDRQTGEWTGKFSSVKVVEEEKRILRLADSLYGKTALKVKMGRVGDSSKNLNAEQSEAFTKILNGNRLACINGYAGTGKSHLLVALKEAYSSSGYGVRAFGPDSATADVLKEKGFKSAENVQRFLFALHHDRRKIANGKEIWIVDEAGKLGNRPLLEFLKEAEKRKVQVVLSGDYAQLNSVGRGGMFQVFCDRFGSHHLQNIQRQKQEIHREIAKNLATGELGLAINKLSADDAIRWSSTKKEAMEELISSWARDTRASPQTSTLIIAHTNDEVRILNEMVRIIKKQRGELGEKEFFCETSLGKVYLSVGDTIEFRKIENDLGVTNGMSGVLIEAEQGKFVVSIREDQKKLRTVVFNPQEYHAYKLGYASTYFRSQGATVDRAYVLHNPALNKRLFYVGLTRHVDQAYYFVSKDQVYCLSDLKRQAMRKDSRENTLGFQSSQEGQLQQALEIKRQEIQGLKESDSFVDRIKGYGLAVYDIVKTKALAVGEHVQDRSADKDFYNPKIVENNIKAAVMEIPDEKEEPKPEKFLETILAQEKKASSEIKAPISNGKSVPDAAAAVPEEFFKRCQDKKPILWDSLAPEKQAALNKYFSIASSVSSLRSVVDLHAESSSQKLESTAYYKEWQEMCGNRNGAAYELVRNVPAGELSALLGKKSVGFIQEQATRYEAYIARLENVRGIDIEQGLKEHIEPLLFSLFPEGPHRRERTSMRFGAKGSLSVVCSGDKVGQYYDFERQEGGGVLKLIQRELGLGAMETKEWAQKFLGTAQDLKVPKVFLKPPSANKGPASEWVGLTPDPKTPAPRLENLPNKKLHHYFEEVARHAYRDENGQLLYYVLRLKDKNDSTKKITPPLSYGYWKSNPDNLCWDLKGSQIEKNVIYNLPDLKKNPSATVLVVEGEKTADLALGKFPEKDFVCVTWPGGAGAVRLADWTPLIGRNVVVWPDNDRAGLEAGESVCHELRRVGVGSLQIIDPEALRKHFPEKWDLADPLPPNVKENLPKELLLSALQKGIDPQQLLYRSSSLNGEGSAATARVNEVLWRVDERLRPELEKKFGAQTWKINEEILSEASRIVLGAGKSEPDGQQRLSWQVAVYRAEHGQDPSSWEINRMKEVVMDPRYTANKESNDLSIDLTITRGCEKVISGKKPNEREIQQELVLTQQVLSESCKSRQDLDRATLDKQSIPGMDISK